MMPIFDKKAWEAFVAHLEKHPEDAKIVVQFMPGGVVKTKGGSLSPEGMALAKLVRPKG
jgi:hypothetical protein